MGSRSLVSVLVSMLLAAAACTVPEPYRAPQQPTPVPPSNEGSTVETRPGTPPTATEEPQELPQPAVREPVLSAASRALVSQAQSQITAKNYPAAASALERALRIEPGNPLLWIELGKLRLGEGNHVQAENMGRKAVAMSANAPRAQASAWRLIADSFRARGKNLEARDAQSRAEALSGR